MAQLPEQIRPYVAALAKHHFWILAAIVPVVLVPLLLQGTSKIEAEIGSRRKDIDDRIAALRRVQGITEHPNEAWSKAIEEQTGKIRKETLAEWTRFWDDQEPLRAWPARLGDDFVRAVTGLKPGGSLERPLLLRYQNTVPDLVRELPKRMGAADLMGGEQGPGGSVPRGRGPEGLPGGPVAPRPGAAAPTAGGLVEWRAEDQSRVFKSFKWEKAPSTTQVVLAQEELWVYGLFCDAIKRANTGAAGAFDAPITLVERLSVGFPAAEERPGGEGGSRIVMHAPPPQPAGGGEMPGGTGLPPGGPEAGMPTTTGAASASRPFHPRFGGDSPAGGPPGAPPPGAEGDGAAPPPSPDDALRQWIYVDFSGKPLTAAELASVPAAKMVHLMPFVLRVVMDERRLDALLSDLASAPVPIDVRQVRINVSDDTPGAPRSTLGTGGSGPDSWPSGAKPAGSRPMDVLVELRGTVGLAPVPDEKAIDGGAATAAEGGGA